MNNAKLAAIAKNTGRPLPEVIEDFEERAAIREYLGVVSRAAAEEGAYFDVAGMGGSRGGSRGGWAAALAALE